MLFLSCVIEMEREETIDGEVVYRYTPFFALLIFFPILLMIVWGRPRSDTYLYLRVFHELPNNVLIGIKEALHSESPGFFMLGVFVKALFGENETAYRLVIALIHAVPIIVLLRRYSKEYLFSVYLFVATGAHLSWMMNGLRQFIAVTITLIAAPWIANKEYVRVICTILLASLFHKTALFMIPVIFIVQGEIWNRKTTAFILIVILSAFVFSRNMDMFDRIASTFGYSTVWAREGGDDGANPLRVFVSAVPMVLAFLSREQIREDNNKMINICVNMSVITAGMMLLAVFTSGILVGRMPIYTSIYNLILLPYAIDACFEENSTLIVKTAAVVLYFIVFYLQWGIG